MLLAIAQAAPDGNAADLEAACSMPYDKLVLLNCTASAVKSAVNEYVKKEHDEAIRKAKAGQS